MLGKGGFKSNGYLGLDIQQLRTNKLLSNSGYVNA